MTFTPDTEIFGEKPWFRPSTLYRMARSKAYLYAGVEIRWRCDPSLLANDDPMPAETVLHYPGGLSDYLTDATADTALPSRATRTAFGAAATAAAVAISTRCGAYPLRLRLACRRLLEHVHG